MPPGPREWTLTSHTLRFEPPDLFWAKFNGVTMPLEDAVRAVEIYRELDDVRPFIFVAEMGEAGRLDPEAGRYLSEHLHPEWTLGSIYIGARLLHRAMARGIATASSPPAHPEGRSLEKIHHVATPQQAHALIARLRTLSRAGKGLAASGT